MYVVFEGTNGVGKSTLIPLVEKQLKMYFESERHDVKINTFHEGDNVQKEIDKINQMILSGDMSTPLSFYAKILTYALGRLKLQSQIEGIDSRNITLADRSFYSSIVYQGGYNFSIRTYVAQVNNFARRPDLIIYIKKNEADDYQELYEYVLPIGKTCIYKDAWVEDESPEESAVKIARIIINRWEKEHSSEPVMLDDDEK